MQQRNLHHQSGAQLAEAVNNENGKAITGRCLKADSSDASDRAIKVLFEPALPEADWTCDIVFFHGLQLGNYRSAWRDTWITAADGGIKVLWPSEWLGRELRTARILSASYDSSAGGGCLTMEEIGQRLVSSLCLQRVGQGRPVILVGHSLGGLVLKQACLIAQKEAGPSAHSNALQAACGEFCRNVAGAFFYATPHGGSQLTTAAKILSSFFGRGPVLDYLSVLGDSSADLNRDFRVQFSDRLQLTTLYETKRTMLFTVVSKASAKQDMRFAYPLDADHINICKPANQESDAYIYLKQYIAESLRQFKGSGQAKATLSVEQPVATREQSLFVQELEEEYTRKILTLMDCLKEQRSLLGERWPEALFLPPVAEHMTPGLLKDTMDARKETGLFWTKVKNAYRPVCGASLLTDSFFTRKWAGRGRDYRLLVEPLDIANWYYRGKNADGFGHYADGIENELTDDNNKRPGRYLLLQQIEQQVFGSDAGYEMQSSLAKAKLFQKMLGSTPWQQYLPAECE